MENRLRESGLYIHVPFCESRCIYCDFYSQTLGPVWREKYLSALKRELAMRSGETDALRTIYFGGGTPSVLSVSQVADVMECIRTYYNICADAEITFEMNPDDVSPDYVAALLEVGINRISLGVQTFDDALLAFLRRRHTASQATDAVCLLADAMHKRGVSNISIDLIYGLPGQSMETWFRDVEKALSLPISHLSAYSLTYEKGTPLHYMLASGRVVQVPEETSLLMFRYLTEEACRRGFFHYEISNFALPGFESRHNSSYWQGVPYIGTGPGAHSFDGCRQRRWNLPDLKRYVGEGSVPCDFERLSDTELFNEKIMTRLRTSEGLDLTELSEEKKDFVINIAKPHVEKKRMRLYKEKLMLTFEGIYTSNDIISDFMKV